MKYVISLGGSVIVPKELDVKFLSSFSKLIKKSKHRFSIVCGGGATARMYQGAAQKLGINDYNSHSIGIEATLLNAFFISNVVNGEFIPGLPLDTVKRFGNIPVVSGGDEHGWTTDIDAAIIAKKIKADALINVTNVDYVYNKDPRVYKNAKKIIKISWKDFMKLPAMKRKPGAHFVFDQDAAKICKAAKIKVYVVGNNIANLKKCLNDKNFVGTTIF